MSVSTRIDRDSCNLSDLQKIVVFSKKKTGKHLNGKKTPKKESGKIQINENFTTKLEFDFSECMHIMFDEYCLFECSF